MSTRYWHTWIDGYRACILGVPRERNWFEDVRPNARDSIQWYAGWDKADNDRSK
ncbi:MAG: hypothetical protein GY931_06215 [Maribacter sp.]|nr:hypothetical protein [Maribacter sp.]